MKCKNKTIIVKGFRYDGNKDYIFDELDLECIVTNDKLGKTLSINDGNIQFTIPFEKLERWLR